MAAGDLEAPRAGLRPPGVRLINKSNRVAKVAIVVAAGAELEVDADVAAQLMGQTQAFTMSDDLSGGGVVETAGDVPAAVPGVSVVEEAGGGSARRASGRRKAD